MYKQICRRIKYVTHTHTRIKSLLITACFSLIYYILFFGSLFRIYIIVSSCHEPACPRSEFIVASRPFSWRSSRRINAR